MVAVSLLVAVVFVILEMKEIYKSKNRPVQNIFAEEKD